MGMTKSERMNVYYWGLTPEAPLCINCQHFYRHYVLKREDSRVGYYDPIDCGHCVYPRMKSRQAYDTCEHFKNKNIPAGADTLERGKERVYEGGSATVAEPDGAEFDP